MRSWRLSFCALLGALLNAAGASLCVGPTATGSGNGSDWNNLLAWTAAPTRGDTWYLADGNYGSETFNAATNGTSRVIIKKATAADHVTETGWASTMGDGQAAITGPVNFTTGYWTLDGNGTHTSASGNTANYGIKITHTGGASGLDIDGDYVTIRYVEVEGSGPDDAGPSNDGIYVVGSVNYQSLTVQYCYIHNQGRCPLLARNLSLMVFEHNWVYLNESYDDGGGGADQHAEGISLYGTIAGSHCDTNIIRYNVWVDVEGTCAACIGLGGSGGTANGNEFYGNLHYWTSEYPNAGQTGSFYSNGSYSSWTTETHSFSRYYNNTVILPSSGGINFACANVGAGTGNVASNNLYVCSGAIGTRIDYDDGTTHDYSGYSGADAEGEPNAQTGITTAIFVDAAGYNFRLSVSTSAGTTLSAPYNVDPLGVTRAVDGVWDRGAYEFDGTPATPGNLRADRVRVTGRIVGR